MGSITYSGVPRMGLLKSNKVQRWFRELCFLSDLMMFSVKPFKLLGPYLAVAVAQQLLLRIPPILSLISLRGGWMNGWIDGQTDGQKDRWNRIKGQS